MSEPQSKVASPDKIEAFKDALKALKASIKALGMDIEEDASVEIRMNQRLFREVWEGWLRTNTFSTDPRPHIVYAGASLLYDPKIEKKKAA